MVGNDAALQRAAPQSREPQPSRLISGSTDLRQCGNRRHEKGLMMNRTTPDWVSHAVWWQVYPLGFVGAEPEAGKIGTESDPVRHRLGRLHEWLDYAVELGASGLALGPMFASQTHGYDTVDYFRIDPRL